MIVKPEHIVTQSGGFILEKVCDMGISAFSLSFYA